MSDRARFVLVGIVNRMDRGYVPVPNPELNNCGELRLIYRLAYSVTVGKESGSSRLPMTINLVYNIPSSKCAVVAKNWIHLEKIPDNKFPTNKDDEKKLNDEMSVLASEKHLGADKLLDLSLFQRAHLKALEINMQLNRTPAGVRRDFGAHSVYLLKVFGWNNVKAEFEESFLENEPDLPKLESNPTLFNELKEFVFTHSKELDMGTLLIPEKFLAKRALSVAPAGMKRLANRPFSGLFKKSDIEEAVNNKVIDYSKLKLVKSSSGFLRRLNDLTCTSCHQTRSVAGFHFMGKDPFKRYPGNSVFTPASAHFMGDQPRRMQIILKKSLEENVDYSRSFAERPDDPAAITQLNGSGLLNGWGAHCALSDDPSYSKWKCSEGLTCLDPVVSDFDSHIGICLKKDSQEVGEICEKGSIKTESRYKDKYTMISRRTVKDPKNYLCSPQSPIPGTNTGGFTAGSIRKKDCENLGAEATCGVLPAAKNGFNACTASSAIPINCVTEYRANVGLRACDNFRTCRDDYICSEGNKEGEGACLPPYFLFQFRVDGHPKM